MLGLLLAASLCIPTGTQLQTSPVRYQVDSRIAVDVRQAVAEWASVGLRFEELPGEHSHEWDAPSYFMLEDTTEPWAGLTSAVPGSFSISLNSLVIPEARKMILMQEIGHGLGFDDMPCTESVMYWKLRYWPTGRLSPGDVIARDKWYPGTHRIYLSRLVK